MSFPIAEVLSKNLLVVSKTANELCAGGMGWGVGVRGGGRGRGGGTSAKKKLIFFFFLSLDFSLNEQLFT